MYLTSTLACHYREEWFAQLGLQEGKTDYPGEVDIHGCLRLYQHQRHLLFSSEALRSKPQCFLSDDVVSGGKKESKLLPLSKNSPYHSTSWLFHQDKGGHFGVAFLPPLISLNRVAGIEKFFLILLHAFFSLMLPKTSGEGRVTAVKGRL